MKILIEYILYNVYYRVDTFYTAMENLYSDEENANL